jgi:hypothetical protein
MKIYAMGTELFYGDGQTNIHDETSSRFSFAKVVREMLRLLLCATVWRVFSLRREDTIYRLEVIE